MNYPLEYSNMRHYKGIVVNFPFCCPNFTLVSMLFTNASPPEFVAVPIKFGVEKACCILIKYFNFVEEHHGGALTLFHEYTPEN